MGSAKDARARSTEASGSAQPGKAHASESAPCAETSSTAKPWRREVVSGASKSKGAAAAMARARKEEVNRVMSSPISAARRFRFRVILLCESRAVSRRISAQLLPPRARREPTLPQKAHAAVAVAAAVRAAHNSALLMSRLAFVAAVAASWGKTALTGAGFFADSYDLFVTEGVTSILKNLGPVVRVNYTVPDGSGRFVVSYFTAACTDGARCMPRTWDVGAGGWAPNPATTFRAEMTPRYAQQTSADKSAVNTAALVGSVLGQLFFGFAGDAMGRRLNWVATAALIIVGSLGSAAAASGVVLPGNLNEAGAWGDTSPRPAGFSTDVYAQLVLWRLVLGFGVGGEYPLSGTIASEGAATAARGAAVLWTFSMQGWGKLTAAVLNYALISGTAAYGGSWPLDATWRFALGFGCALSAATIYFRWRMEESHIYVKAAAAAAASAAAAAGAPPGGARRGAPLGEALAGAARRVHAALAATVAVLWGCRWTLLGTASTWFLIDVTFYGQSLMSSAVLADALAANVAGATALDKLRASLASTCYVMLIALPGYWVAIAAVERVGRRPLQLWGFVATAAAFVVLGAAFNTPLRTGAGGAGFLIFYGLTYFATNAGPNAMTFLVPTEAFPTVARASAHGLSAASGKIGATLGSIVLLDIFYSFCVSQRDASGAPNCSALADPSPAQREEIGRGVIAVMIVCAVVALAGALMTHFFVPETGGRSLEDVDAAAGARAAAPAAAAGDGGGGGSDGGDGVVHGANPLAGSKAPREW
jgi:PHS family inorganic phosphate transporter-like MFS transporter